MGIPPATLASKVYDLCFQHLIILPYSQIRALLAVITGLPCSVMSNFASSNPPINSHMISMSGSLTIDKESVVKTDSLTFIDLSLFNERTDARVGISLTQGFFPMHFDFQ